MSPKAANSPESLPARPACPPKPWRRREVALHLTIPFFILSAAFGAITIWFQRTRAIGFHGAMPSVLDRLSSAGWGLLAYCREALFPRHLMPIYPARSTAAGEGGVLVLAVAAAACFWLFRWSVRLRQGFSGQGALREGDGGRVEPNRVLARTTPLPSASAMSAEALAKEECRVLPHTCAAAILALSWFGLNLIPVLGIIPMSYLRVAPRADHFLYLALPAATGLVAAALSGALRLFRDSRQKSGEAATEKSRPRVGSATGISIILCGCAVGIAVGALAVSSRSYTRTFLNEATLWETAVTLNPRSWFARNNWGKVLLDRGDTRAAAGELSTAVRLQPGSAEAHANLGNAYSALGRQAAALAEYRQAVSVDPGFAGAHYDLGQALLIKGDSTGAALELTEAVRLNPHYAVAHNNLGLALARLGKPAEAMEEYRSALALDPASPEAHLNLGNALLRADRAVEAVAEYRAALRLNERYIAAHRNLAVALGKLGQRQAADAEYDEASRLIEAADRHSSPPESGGPPPPPSKP